MGVGPLSVRGQRPVLSAWSGRLPTPARRRAGGRTRPRWQGAAARRRLRAWVVDPASRPACRRSHRHRRRRRHARGGLPPGRREGRAQRELAAAARRVTAGRPPTGSGGDVRAVLPLAGPAPSRRCGARNAGSWRRRGAPARHHPRRSRHRRRAPSPPATTRRDHPPRAALPRHSAPGRPPPALTRTRTPSTVLRA